MKTKKRLIAWFTSLALTLSFVLPGNVLSAYADETIEQVTVEEAEVVKDEVNDSITSEPSEAVKTEVAEQTTEEAATEPVANETVKIQVLATTDLHGKFLNYDYATMSQAAGGLNQIATVVKNEMANNPNTIVVDNGDTIQGNYNHLFLTEEYLKNNINPMVFGMNNIGYTSFSLGNHEFNYGMNILNKIAEQAKDGGTAVLCANLYKDGVRVFDPYTIKTIDGVRVAVIGVVTNHITRWDADKLVGYIPTNPAEEVQKVMSEIKDNADVFVVTSHMGLTSEYGDGDSATDIANLNPEVDVIIAGHSHTTIQEQVVNGVLVTQPTNNGQGVSKAVLEVEKAAEGFKVINKSASVIKLEKTSPVDETLTNALKKYDDIAKADANSVIGKLEGNNLAEADEVKGIPQSFVNDQGVTDLINEVQLYYSEEHLKSLGIDTSKIHHVSGAAMLSATSNLEAGDITKSDLANIYKFDNKLYTIKTTGKQLKKYLEWTATLYNTFEKGDLTISFNPGFASYKYDMLSGVTYELNISKPVGKRVENLKFQDGKVVADADEIYLTVNDYRYNSNLSPMFDKGEHTKVYESTNDSLSDIRDMIARYITEVKGGTITRSVDDNWKLTGVEYNDDLRAEVVKLINDGTLTQQMNYGIVSKPLTWKEVSEQLTAAGKTEKLAELKELITTTTVDMLSINDFHGNVLESGKNIGAAKLAGVINRYNSKESDIYSVIPVAAGDLYQGTAISNLTYGEPVSIMLKAIGLEGSAIGNHEFDWGINKVNKWSEDGGFRFLAANIVKKGTEERVEYADPYKVVEANGVKIGIIGITTPETATATLAENIKDVDFLDPAKTVEKWTKILKETEKVDAVVVVAHSAAYQDKAGNITGEAADIAKVSGVNAVISGHNHAFVSGKVNGVPIVQGGYNGRGLAKLSFTFDNNNKLVSVEPSVDLLYENVANLPEDAKVKADIAVINDSLQDIFNVKVTTLPERLSHDEKNNAVTQLGVVVAETMRQLAGTQIGLTNGGGIRRSLEQGDVTVGDMYEILPFDNTLVTVDVKGSDLVGLIEHGINTVGFAWGQFAGIKVEYNSATGKVSSIRLNDGTDIVPYKYYSVVINDFMLTGGDGYNFTSAKNPYNTNIVMRDAMADYWKTNGVPQVDFNVLTATDTNNVIDILSFNDFHGNVLEASKNIGAGKLAGVINSYRTMEDGNYGVIPVAAGDLYQGTAISNIKYGAPVTDMLKGLGLVASAIGNHEYDWGADRISTWAQEGGFDFLAANVVKKGTHELVEYAKPYKIVEKNGVKIAIIGIATPETAEKTLAENVKDIEFLDPAETVASYIDKVKAEGANAVVVLAHSAAYQDDTTKAITGEAADIAMVEGVDAVISGHNHAFVSGTVDRNGKAIPVVQGGYNGRGLAAVRFGFDAENNLVNVEPSVKLLFEDVKNLPVDEAVAAKIKEHNDELAPMMAEEVTNLEKELSHEDRNSAVTPLGVVVAETMRQIAGTQIGITNGGGIRRSLAAGKVTIGDMYEILPFDNTLVTVKVTGEELVKIIEHGINTKNFGWGQFAGIKVWYDKETGKVSSIRLNDGTKIDPKAEYSVVINDFMLTGGDGYDFSKATEVKDTFVVMRDAMAKNWKENGVPKVDYNVLVAGVDNTVDPEKPVKPEEPKPEKPGTLPQTGAPIGADMVAMMGIVTVAIGGVVYKRRKKNA